MNEEGLSFNTAENVEVKTKENSIISNTAFDLDELLEKDITRDQFFTAKDLMEKFRLGELKTSEVFDVELLAKWFAVGDVMGAWHGFSFNNMRFYFNPITGKFEPVPDDDYNERFEKLDKDLISNHITNYHTLCKHHNYQETTTI